MSTPAGFPQLEFFEFVVGHLGIVIAALFLVVGLRRRPRRGSVRRVFTIYRVTAGGLSWLAGLGPVTTHVSPRRSTAWPFAW